MKHVSSLRSLSDDEVLRHLSELVSQSRRIEAEVVAHIAEVDHRGLYAAKACSSMFSYCLEVLNLSEPEAYLRIGVGRTARRFPAVLAMLADGRLHLSGIALLAPHLTDENCETVLARAARRSKRKIEELIAELAPKPDVPAAIRKLPTPPSALPVQLRPDGVQISEIPIAPPAAVKAVPPAPPRPEPLSPERFKVTFTASRVLKDKLERLQALMDGELEPVIEAAVSEKLERLEAKRYGASSKPRKSPAQSDTRAKSRYVPAAVRRRVWERDGGRCSFVDRSGRRCTERHRLEFHHEDPFGLGGDHDPEKMRLLCKRHNLHLAERVYGKDVMESYRNKGGRVSETPPVDGLTRVFRSPPTISPPWVH